MFGRLTRWTSFFVFPIIAAIKSGSGPSHTVFVIILSVASYEHCSSVAAAESTESAAACVHSFQRNKSAVGDV